MKQNVAIIVRIAADRTDEFEAMFEREELPVWDDFIARGLLLEASLTRVEGGSEMPPGSGGMGGGPEGVQDYILHVVARDMDAHNAHDQDPRFQAFLAKAQELQPLEPLVFFGTAVFERVT